MARQTNTGFPFITHAIEGGVRGTEWRYIAGDRKRQPQRWFDTLADAIRYVFGPGMYAEWKRRHGVQT